MTLIDEAYQIEAGESLQLTSLYVLDLAVDKLKCGNVMQKLGIIYQSCPVIIG